MSYYGRVSCLPAGYYEGELSLSERKVRLGLIDRNVNGYHGERPSQMGESEDVLLIDYDGDGKFKGYSSGTESDIVSMETLPIMRVVQMPDDNFYRLKVAEDGSTLRLLPVEEPIGKVKADCDGIAMALMGEDGLLMIRSSGNEVSLPVGRYNVQYLVLCAKDKSGSMWKAPMYAYNRRLRLRVVSDEPVELKAGAPFKLALSAGQYGARC
jgi:hypothetical protein